MNAKYATNRVQQTDATTKNAKNIKKGKRCNKQKRYMNGILIEIKNIELIKTILPTETIQEIVKSLK